MYAQIDLDGRAGTLRVSGHGMPTVDLVRKPGTEPDRHTPIGTRRPDLLTLTVDGVGARIRPARGRLWRRSYRVDATVGGVTYRLVPCSHRESRLLRDGRRIGALESAGDGRADADWDEGVPVEPRDVAVGTALAAAFGTGAAPWWETAADVIGELIP